MNGVLRLCLLGIMLAAAAAETGHFEADEEEQVKRAALADFRKRFNHWGPEEPAAEHRGRHHGQRGGEHERAGGGDKRAALADFKRAALADFKRAALADFKRAALADFKRAALADFKRSERLHHERDEGERAQHHHPSKSVKHYNKKSYYWDICTRMEDGQEKYYACKKRL